MTATQKIVVVVGGPTGPTGTIKGVNILAAFTGLTGTFAQWAQATGATGPHGTFETVYNIGATGVKGAHKTIILPGFSGNTVGGLPIGAIGTGLYSGWTLSWGDEFNSLNLVSAANPKGSYFTTRLYAAASGAFGGGPRGDYSILGTAYDTDPNITGYLDSNRGVPVGFSNLFQPAPSIVRLLNRKATLAERAFFAPTASGINGGVRDQVSAVLMGHGSIVYYVGGIGNIIEWRARFSPKATNPAGWHPTLWTLSNAPAASFNGDESDIEGNSQSLHLDHNHWVAGADTSTAGSAANFMDGNFHTFTQVQTTTGIALYIDGVLNQSYVGNANATGVAATVLMSAHVYNGTFFAEAYSQAAWDTAGANAFIDIDWVRVWRPSTTAHYQSATTIPDLNLAYNGTGNIVFPSAASLWGDGTVTEYVQVLPNESLDPGGAEQTTFLQFPAGLGISYTPGTRTLAVNLSAASGNAGRLFGTLHATKLDGSTCAPIRFTINRGPNIIPSNVDCAVGSALSYDLYARCDCGSILPKTLGVTNLPTGLSFSSTTGLITGTPADVAETATVTVTNAAGQTATKNLTFINNSSYQAETHAFLNSLFLLPSQTKTDAFDAYISSLKTNGIWTKLDVLDILALDDAQSSVLNWKGGLLNAQLISTPTFTADRGYTTDGAVTGVDSFYNPTSSGQVTLNNAAYTIWSLTPGELASSGIGCQQSTNLVSITPYNTSGQLGFRVHDATADVVTNTAATGQGMFSVVRSGATTKLAYLNGVQMGATLATTSTAIPNATFSIGSINGGASFTARQFAMIAIGTARTPTQEANFYSATRTLMTVLGVP